MHLTNMALFIVAASIVRVAIAQTIHIVTVGDKGSFFDPQVLVANAGDTVVFRWTGMAHSVTQSSFASPCSPLPGGFDSGVASNPPQQLVIPEWNLTITDDTKPIWFYCKVTLPVPHCTAGMVGAINADPKDGNQSFATFLQKAKSIADPPKPSLVPPALTGIGAFATTTPVPMFNVTNTSSTDSTSMSSTSSTDTPIPTTTTTQAQPTSTTTSAGITASEKGGIAGGIVGGLIVTSLLFLLFLSCRRGRQYKKEVEEAKMLYSQSSGEVLNIGRSGTSYRGGPYEPSPKSVSLVPQNQHPPGSPSITDFLELEGATDASINIKELAAEIVKGIKQDGSVKERIRTDGTLETVPELGIANPISRNTSATATTGSLRAQDSVRAESTRGSESTRGAESTRGTESAPGTAGTEAGDSIRTLPTRGVAPRQLPRPPSGPARSEDTYSVDTLPAYFPGQNR